MGFLITLAGVIVLSPDALLIRLVTADNWTIILYRGAFTALALVLYVSVRHQGRLVDLFRQVDRPALVAGLLYGCGNIFFVQSINRTWVANTLIILAATPLIAAVFSRVFLQEPQWRATWVAICVVLAGIAAIFADGLGGGQMVGDVLAVGSAAAMAGNLTAHRVSRTPTPLPSIILGAALAALLSAPLASPTSVSVADICVLLVLGGIVMPISFGLIFVGPRYIPAAEVALIMLLEAILGPLLVWVVIGERPGLRVVLCGVVILATVFVHAVILNRRRRASSCPPSAQNE